MSYRTRAPFLDKDVFFSSSGVAKELRDSSSPSIREIALLPIGCVEQHGPFLPVQTDSILAEGLAHHLQETLSGEDYSVRSFPPVHFTPTQTNSDFMGTVSVSADVFGAYTEEICRSLMLQSFDAVILVNGHGPAEFRLKEIAFKLVNEQFQRRKTHIKPLLVVNGYEFDSQIGQMLGLNPGRHADWREFLSLYFLLGRSYFPEDALKKMSAFQASNDFTVESTAVLGIPMQFRSIEGIQGDPFPFDVKDVPELATKTWNFIVQMATEKIRQELDRFYSMTNIFKTESGRLR